LGTSRSKYPWIYDRRSDLLVAGSGARPGRAVVVLALIVAAILAYVDLSSNRSILRGLKDAVFPSSTPGQRVRDNIMEGLRPGR